MILMIFISGCKCVNKCVHVCVHERMGVWTLKQHVLACTCVHTCVCRPRGGGGGGLTTYI